MKTKVVACYLMDQARTVYKVYRYADFDFVVNGAKIGLFDRELRWRELQCFPENELDKAKEFAMRVSSSPIDVNPERLIAEYGT